MFLGVGDAIRPHDGVVARRPGNSASDAIVDCRLVPGHKVGPTTRPSISRATLLGELNFWDIC